MAVEPLADKMIMYSMEFCPTCNKAKETLDHEGIAYEERIVDDSEEWQEDVLKYTKQASVPVFLHPSGDWEVGFRGEIG